MITRLLICLYCFIAGALDFPSAYGFSTLWALKSHGSKVLLSHKDTNNEIEATESLDPYLELSRISGYRSAVLSSVDECSKLLQRIQFEDLDPFWEQIKLEASAAVEVEPEAGPLLYQGILSQSSLMEAICSVVAHNLETELIPATQLKSLFLEMLSPEDERTIRLDLQAVVTRSPSVSNAMGAGKFVVCLTSGLTIHRLTV